MGSRRPREGSTICDKFPSQKWVNRRPTDPPSACQAFLHEVDAEDKEEQGDTYYPSEAD